MLEKERQGEHWPIVIAHNFSGHSAAVAHFLPHCTQERERERKRESSHRYRGRHVIARERRDEIMGVYWESARESARVRSRQIRGRTSLAICVTTCDQR